MRTNLPKFAINTQAVINNCNYCYPSYLQQCNSSVNNTMHLTKKNNYKTMLHVTVMDRKVS